MAAITSQTFRPQPVFDLPRGARAAAAVFLAGAALLRRLLRGVQVNAAQRSLAQDVERVRDLAARYAKTDPGFAADLYAAAARHESQDER